MVEMGRRYIDMAYKSMLLRLELIRIITPTPPHPEKKRKRKKRLERSPVIHLASLP
jgi:hypothetical protein